MWNTTSSAPSEMCSTAAFVCHSWKASQAVEYHVGMSTRSVVDSSKQHVCAIRNMLSEKQWAVQDRNMQTLDQRSSYQGPSIHYRYCISFEGRVGLQPIPADIGWEAGYFYRSTQFSPYVNYITTAKYVQYMRGELLYSRTLQSLIPSTARLENLTNSAGGVRGEGGGKGCESDSDTRKMNGDTDSEGAWLRLQRCPKQELPLGFAVRSTAATTGGPVHFPTPCQLAANGCWGKVNFDYTTVVLQYIYVKRRHINTVWEDRYRKHNHCRYSNNYDANDISSEPENTKIRLSGDFILGIQLNVLFCLYLTPVWFYFYFIFIWCC